MPGQHLDVLPATLHFASRRFRVSSVRFADFPSTVPRCLKAAALIVGNRPSARNRVCLLHQESPSHEVESTILMRVGAECPAMA